MHKRYLVFHFATYYPSGGWGDFVNDFDSFEDAKLALMQCYELYYRSSGHIVDTKQNCILYHENIFGNKFWNLDYKEWLTYEEEEEKDRIKRLKESSGLTKEQLQQEINHRLSVHTDCTLDCSYCALGKRHPIGNCILCGWGPSPASIDFMGLKPLPIHEINALVSN